MCSMMIVIMSRMIVPLIFTVIQTERLLLVLQGWKAFREEALKPPTRWEKTINHKDDICSPALKTIITRSLPVLSHRVERWRNGASETRGESLNLWSALRVQIERRIVGWIIGTKLQKELNSSSEDSSTIYLPEHHTDKSRLAGLRTELQWPLWVISLPAGIDGSLQGFQLGDSCPDDSCSGAGGGVMSHEWTETLFS